MVGNRRALGVAVVGFGWMGQAHTRAYARVHHHFPDLVPAPRLVRVEDDIPGRAGEASGQFGFRSAGLDWREVITDPDVQAVSVTAPNFLHREIGVAVAEAGKHLWIEKPVGIDREDALAVADAVRAAGVQCTVGFNYRHAPAVQSARELIISGGIGDVTHASFSLLSDYAAHPDGALTWRYDRELGGPGVLGDLASHGVDLACFLLGDITAVVADSAIFIAERPVPTGATRGHARSSGGVRRPVQNEDYGSALLRFASGARGVLDVSRVAVGEQNTYGFEIHGVTGSVSWDFRRMGELRVSGGGSYQDQSTAVQFVGPGQGDYAAFQPGAAVGMGFDDLKVIEAAGFLRSIAEGRSCGPTAEDAVRSAAVVEAMSSSVGSGQWARPQRRP